MVYVVQKINKRKKKLKETRRNFEMLMFYTRVSNTLHTGYWLLVKNEFAKIICHASDVKPSNRTRARATIDNYYLGQLGQIGRVRARECAKAISKRAVLKQRAQETSLSRYRERDTWFEK